MHLKFALGQRWRTGFEIGDSGCQSVPQQADKAQAWLPTGASISVKLIRIFTFDTRIKRLDGQHVGISIARGVKDWPQPADFLS